MALPTTNLSFYSDLILTLAGGKTIPPYTFSWWFNSSSINKYGLDSTYVDGITPDDKLSTVNTPPYKLGYFRNYDHTASAPTVDAHINFTTLGNYWITGSVTLQFDAGRGSWTFLDQVSFSSQLSAYVNFTGDYSGYFLRQVLYVTWTDGQFGIPQSPDYVEWSFDDINYTTGTNSGSFSSPQTIYWKVHKP